MSSDEIAMALTVFVLGLWFVWHYRVVFAGILLGIWFVFYILFLPALFVGVGWWVAGPMGALVTGCTFLILLGIVVLIKAAQLHAEQSRQLHSARSRE